MTYLPINSTTKIIPSKKGAPLLLASSALIGGMLMSEFIGGELFTEIARWLMFLGKLGVSGAFAVVWIWVAEMYPTE